MRFKDKKVAAIVAARMDSKRMYGKPMKLITGKPTIEHVIERVKKLRNIDQIIIATSDKKENSVFIELAKRLNVDYFIGDEEDVLKRYVDCIKKFDVDVLLRLTSENPLFYFEKLDKFIEEHIDKGYDFSYAIDLPLGCIVEIINSAALIKSHELGEDKHKSELVTSFIKDNKDMFKIKKYELDKELNRPDIRLTIDTKRDLRLANIIFEKIKKDTILVRDVISFLDKNPDFKKINLDIPTGTSRIW
ncbi:MAG: hypothetical protein JSW73_04450 [Candidatus Woesearchaeota archaeon]|nr:MAG: hypothetical protein JSW73_04450 [Candidatus Woesearchaeota archaeon]